MPSNYAIDDSYGSEALLEESGPIRLDELEGAQPTEEMRQVKCDVCGEPATGLLPDGGSGLPVCDDHSKEES
jgi:hypothetical protein